MAYCGKCGTQLSEGMNYCPKCGTGIGNNENKKGEQDSFSDNIKPVSETNDDTVFVCSSKSKKVWFITLAVLLALAVSVTIYIHLNKPETLTNAYAILKGQGNETAKPLQTTNDSNLVDYGDNGDYDVEDNEPKTPLYTSPMAFHSKESVLSHLANKTFRYNEYCEIHFDESGMVVRVGKEISSVYLLQCSSQSAVIKYTAKEGNYFYYLVQIDENKLQVIDLTYGCMVYHQEIVDEDYSSCPSIYSSTLSFESEEDVIKQLTSRRFRNNQGEEIVFDDEGYYIIECLIDNTRYIEKCKVTVSSYLSQSAIISISGSGSIIVQIDNDKIQIVNWVSGEVFN